MATRNQKLELAYGPAMGGEKHGRLVCKFELDRPLNEAPRVKLLLRSPQGF